MKTQNWYLWIGVWLGILILSLVNNALVVTNHNQFLFDLYIFGISVIVLILIFLLKRRSEQ